MITVCAQQLPGRNRVEAMQTEVGALHEAMAGLHGEMGAIQRELDGTKASQEKMAKGETIFG